MPPRPQHPPRRAAAITQQELARLAEVNQATVSRCFQKPETVNDATRKRVLDLAERHGYQPNHSARTMRRGSSDIATFLQDANDYRSPLIPDLLHAIAGALHDHGWHLLYARLPDREADDRERLPHVLRQTMAEGLLVNYHGLMPDALADALDASRLPVVWLNSKRPTNSVHPDDIEGGCRIARELVAAGHRRICWLEPRLTLPPDVTPHYSRTDRRDGLEQELRTHGLQPMVRHVDCGSDLSLMVDQVEHILRERHRPTAIVTYGGPEIEATIAAAARLGLAVPRDLSLAGFAPVPLAPGLLVTHVVPDWQALGTAGVDLLLDLVVNRTRRQPSRTSAVIFHRGASLAPVGA